MYESLKKKQNQINLIIYELLTIKFLQFQRFLSREEENQKRSKSLLLWTLEGVKVLIPTTVTQLIHIINNSYEFIRQSIK